MSRITKTILILLSTLLIFTFTACSKEEEEEANVPTSEELIASQYNDLVSAFPEDDDTSSIIRYIGSWADMKEISHSESDGILILSVPASKGYEDKDSLALTTEITGENTENEMQSLACLLYTVSSLDKHPAVNAAIIPEGKSDCLPDEIVNAGRVINLSYSSKAALYTSGAASSDIKLTADVSYQEPRYDTAYKISIKHLEGGVINNIEEAHANPLLSINSFLTGLKNSGIVYDLAEYKCSPSYNSYLSGASATVVISSSDEEKFIGKLDKYVDKFNDKWLESNEEMEITYKKVKTPSSVLDSSSEEKLTSVLYTELTGICNEEEEEENDGIQAYVNIAGVKIKDGTAVIKIKSYADTNTRLKEINNQIETLAEMSDYSFKRINRVKKWKSDLTEDITETAQSLNISLPDEDQIIRTLPCSYIRSKNSDARVIAFGINFDNWEDVSTLIKEYVK